MSQGNPGVNQMRQSTSAFASVGSQPSARDGDLEIARVAVNHIQAASVPNEPQVRSSSFYGSSYAPPPQSTPSAAYSSPYNLPTQPTPNATFRSDTNALQPHPSSFYGFSYTPPPPIIPSSPAPAYTASQLPPPSQPAPTTTFHPNSNASQARPSSFHVPSYTTPPYTPPPSTLAPAPTPARPVSQVSLSPAQSASNTPFRLDTDAIIEGFIEGYTEELSRTTCEAITAAQERGASQAEMDVLIKEQTIAMAMGIARGRVLATALRTQLEEINASAEGSEQPPGYDQVMRERAHEAVQNPSLQGLEGRWRTEYEESLRLKEEMNLAKLRGAPQEVIMSTTLNFFSALMRTQLVLEEDTDRNPVLMAHYKRQLDLLERIKRTTDRDECLRLLDLLDLSGERIGKTSKEKASACSWFVAAMFLLLALGGMATQMALSILISQGTQGSDLTLDSSLSVQVTCGNLGPRTGSCDIPQHWSLFFGYGSPILIIITLLWITCCDRKAKYNFTTYASIVTVGCTIAALVGSTMLAVHGYSKSDCSSCSEHAVYVPTPKLLMMNRGQAAGSYATVIGLFFVLVFAWAA